MGDISNLEMSWRSVMMAMVCLPVVICAIILLFRKTESAASRYLAGFLIASVLGMGPQIIGYAGFYNVWPGLTFFPIFAVGLWLGPLLYLHADRLMRGGSLGWRKYLLLPGLLQTTYYVWAFFTLGDYRAKWDYNGAVHAPYIIPVESLVEVGLMLFALIAIWRLVKRYRRYLDATSSAAMDYDPIWLRNIILALLIGGGIYTGLEITALLRPVSYNTAFPFQVLIMAVMAWFAIDAAWRLLKPFPKLKIITKGEVENTESKDWSKEALRLQERVLSEKWYLESRLSIRDVAARMGTNETYLSRTLNRGMGQSFNRFINGLRIDHAKDLMTSSKDSLLTIALESGFNSKATFNRVFKTIARMTPSQFKTSQNP